MIEPKYYNGTKLLSLTDINGNKPSIYICTTNRTGGKTTYFSRLLVNRFLDKNEKFCLFYRFKDELDDVSEKFFKDVGSLFFPNYYMREESINKGTIKKLFLCEKNQADDKKNGRECGYAVAINVADKIKRVSHLLSDTKRIMFDEFQSETYHYCPNEVNKFLSLYTSIARGQGEQSRYVPVFMIGNPVTLLNPYYVAMNISVNLQRNTKYLRGDGYVLEQGYVESAANAQKESGVFRAFANSEYAEYSAEGAYLNDSDSFIEKLTGKSTYLCTIKYEGVNYGIRSFAEQGVVYCDDRPDMTFARRIAVTTEDHNINYVMLRSEDFLLANLRYYFERGCFRFKNLRCKECVIKSLSY